MLSIHQSYENVIFKYSFTFLNRNTADKDLIFIKKKVVGFFKDLITKSSDNIEY